MIRIKLSLLCLQTLIISFAFLIPLNNNFAGECFQSRQEMLDEYNESIDRITKTPNGESFLGPWIENCWYYWDLRYRNDDLNEELGTAILRTISSPIIPQEVKTKSLEIARNAAPANIFNEMISLLKAGGDQQDLAFDILLAIWQHNAKLNRDIANYNYIHLFKQTLPQAFVPPFKDRTYIYNYGRGQRPEVQPAYWLCSFYATMGHVYAFDYTKAKKILVENDLFYPSKCAFGKIFQDPRAYEDSKCIKYDFESGLFFSLLRHLELEFKIDWLNKIPPHQLRLLRNGILATYGWKFKDAKLRNWFSSYSRDACRNSVCGIVNDKYSDSYLTDTDRKNIAAIAELEKLTSDSIPSGR